MPPVYKKLTSTESFDGTKPLDMSDDVQLIYIPNFISTDIADEVFSRMSDMDVSPLSQHSYIGNFKRHITPKRLTYAHVPVACRYRYKGIDLIRNEDGDFTEMFELLSEKLAEHGHSTIAPNASVSNGYRYNGTDYIALHTDDEKFLAKGNSKYWPDSTVFTFTFLKDNENPMTYKFGNPDTGLGFSLTPRHGSLLIQGRTLHEVLPKNSLSRSSADIGRVSITLRNLNNICPHGNNMKCQKITCPSNIGASNYLYYSNSDSGSAAT